MSSTRKRIHRLAICLALAGVLCRGLIPAGFMPATGEAARHGAVFVVCPHGEMRAHGQAGGNPGGPSLEQCSFGAAAAPAAPSVKVAFSFTPDLIYFRPEWATVQHSGASPHLQPPARAPPVQS